LRSKPSHDGDATGRDRTHRDQHKKALDIEATRTTGGRQLIEVIKTTTVNRDPKEVYRFWRNFENNTGDEDQRYSRTRIHGPSRGGGKPGD
jgi:hypothetical protein